MIKLASPVTLDAFQGGAQVQYIRVEANDLNVEGGKVNGARFSLIAPDGVTVVTSYPTSGQTIPAGVLTSIRSAWQSFFEGLAGQAAGTSTWV